VSTPAGTTRTAPTTVFLHLGLAKTGTTSIQAALEQSQERYAAHGLCLPGGRHHAQRRAAYDLVGRRIEGDRGSVAGSFRQLVEAVDRCDTPRAVVSEELLALAQPRHVRRLGRALGAHQLEVVIGVRDLGRTLLSGWQQEVVNAQTFGWRTFADAVRDPDRGAVRAGVAFWLRHDVLRVLDTWERLVPRDRVHLVTLPPPGSPGEVLLDRFADAVGLPADVLRLDGSPRNTSLGPVELEVVRRLNLGLGDLPRRQYLAVVERGIRPGLQRPGVRALALPPEDLGWVAERSAELVDRLRERGYQVHGDLEELRTPASPSSDVSHAAVRRIDDVTSAELLEASELALASLGRRHGALVARHRRAVAPPQEDAPVAERAGSRLRALAFQARVAALERADRNPVLAWAARTALRRPLRRPLRRRPD
jgi:hypothetical protein